MHAKCSSRIKGITGKTMNKKITLACKECSSRNYSTNKKQSTSAERLIVKKYCKYCKKHIEHRETKEFQLEDIVKILDFFKDVAREMRKVTWTIARELYTYTITVVVNVAFVTAIMSVVDVGMMPLVK